MKIGLFFGTFNPIHIGHLIIAEFMSSATDIDQVWLIVSPQNPLKSKSSLLDEKQRLYMVNIATEDNPKLRASNIEFHLPKPSYTVDTLAHLQDKYPQHEFVLIMGSDNVNTLHKWKNHEAILKHYSIYVYNRADTGKGPLHDHPSIRYFEVPLLNISATYIRQSIRENRSIQYLIPQKVQRYIEEMHLYK